MVQAAVLEKEKFRNTKIITRRGKAFGENIHYAPVVLSEIKHLVLDYPIFFMKDEETGQFGLHVLLGFYEGENLFLNDDTWQSNYLPLHIQRQPFFTGRNKKDENSKPFIAIDVDSKRVQETEGEALFTEEGEATQYLQTVQKILGALNDGFTETNQFIETLLEKELIESAQLSIQFANQEEQQIYEGVYTVNADKLASLRGQDLEGLHKNGFLSACYLMLSSIGHVRKMIGWKNKQ